MYGLLGYIRTVWALPAHPHDRAASRLGHRKPSVNTVRDAPQVYLGGRLQYSHEDNGNQAKQFISAAVELARRRSYLLMPCRMAHAAWPILQQIYGDGLLGNRCSKINRGRHPSKERLTCSIFHIQTSIESPRRTFLCTFLYGSFHTLK